VPSSEFLAIAQRYQSTTQIVWVQEEPENMGARLFAMPLLHGLAGPGVEVAWVAREASASPATGSSKVHDAEQQKLLDAAFGPIDQPVTIS
jgi:2-oxoglutarate dehydrogenase complex dehydrogenase (E1) component-like enzyme